MSAHVPHATNRRLPGTADHYAAPSRPAGRLHPQRGSPNDAPARRWTSGSASGSPRAPTSSSSAGWYPRRRPISSSRPSGTLPARTKLVVAGVRPTPTATSPGAPDGGARSPHRLHRLRLREPAGRRCTPRPPPSSSPPARRTDPSRCSKPPPTDCRWWPATFPRTSKCWEEKAPARGSSPTGDILELAARPRSRAGRHRRGAGRRRPPRLRVLGNPRWDDVRLGHRAALPAGARPDRRGRRRHRSHQTSPSSPPRSAFRSPRTTSGEADVLTDPVSWWAPPVPAPACSTSASASTRRRLDLETGSAGSPASRPRRPQPGSHPVAGSAARGVVGGGGNAYVSARPADWWSGSSPCPSRESRSFAHCGMPTPTALSPVVADGDPRCSPGVRRPGDPEQRRPRLRQQANRQQLADSPPARPPSPPPASSRS